MTKLGIGIDFGTTNSAAAIFDGETVSLIQLERAGPIMPSATYIDQALQSKTGQSAIDQYIADNTGRTVELIPEVVGEVSKFVEHGDGGEMNETQRESTEEESKQPVSILPGHAAGPFLRGDAASGHGRPGRGHLISQAALTVGVMAPSWRTTRSDE